MRRRLARFALAAGVFLSAAAPLTPHSARASVSIDLTLGELCRGAELVGVFVPVEARSVWEPSEHGRRIVTYHRLRLDRLIAGEAPEMGETWVRTLGGRVADLAQRVDGEAVFPPQTPSLLFLSSRDDGTMQVVGMAQGQYPVRATGDEPPRLEPHPAPGALVPRATGSDGAAGASARAVLAHKTLSEAAALITAARHHAR